MSKRRHVSLGMAAALAAALLLGASNASAAGRAGDFPAVDVNVNDLASLQRGARLFVNYCQGCHSMQYMRYQRLADDLELSEEMVMSNLVFADKKIGDTMTIAMSKDAGEQWFGKAPPDLSVTGRSRGADWIHAYLVSYYRDDAGAWNNTVSENTAMPHPLWRLQGIQEPVYETRTDGAVEVRTVTGLELVEPGTMSPEAYSDAMLDLTNFLVYASEPAQLKRKDIGIWVLLFLAFFALVAYLLKREYWRDVH